MSSLCVSAASTLRPSTLLCKRRQFLLQLSCWSRTYASEPTDLPKRVKGQRFRLDEKLQTPGIELPAADDWWKVYRFPEKRKRKTLCNVETAKKLAETFVPEGSKGKVIIEAWAGPGQLTRALLALPRERIRKIIVLEEEPKFYEWLKPLQAVDDRVHVVEQDAFDWSTYTYLEQTGLLSDVETVDWSSGVHPTLQYIAQTPNNVHGEQLIAQFARAIPDRKWLFRYGRVPLDITTSATMYERLTAPPTTKNTARCKVSVMAQAAAEVVKSYPGSALLPTADHFFQPTTRNFASRLGPGADIFVQPARITPLATPFIDPGDLDVWDYVARNLFIIKATPLVKGITGLGPGAQSLLKKLDDPSLPAELRVDVKKAPRELSIQDWRNLVRVFAEWPFKPTSLAIGGLFMQDGRV